MPSLEELDRIYGTDAMEVYRIIGRGLYADRPRSRKLLRDHTCPDCQAELSDRPLKATVGSRGAAPARAPTRPPGITSTSAPGGPGCPCRRRPCSSTTVAFRATLRDPR
jgi:hypothetical protein